MSIYRIAENGESVYHIAAYQYADETVRYAASELQKYLLRSTGAAIPYFSDRCAQIGPEIRVGGEVRGTMQKSPRLEGKGEEAFSILGEGEHIYITGNSSRGVLYGVYYFLERFCGFRCFTRDVETIDEHNVLEVSLDEIVIEPAFEFRDTYFRFAFDGDFCAKNRSNTSLGDVSVAKGGRMKWFNFHHSFFDLVSVEKYFDTHPEYFSEVDGKRINNGQLCLSNPEVVKIAEESLRKQIRENPECRIFSVAQNDNIRRCQCEKCMAIEKEEGSPAGPIIRFVNQLADAIKEDYPDILLHTFAYKYSVPAPKYVVARDNVIVRICSISCRFDKPFRELADEGSEAEKEFVNALYEWKSHAKRLYVWNYAVNFRNYLQPFIHLRTLKKNIRFFKELGILGVLEQGNFAYGGGAACDDLKSYIISRLLFDPDTDVADEIGRFCRAVYGEYGGAKFEEYVYLMMAACENAPISIKQDPDASYITDELVQRAENIFQEAIRAAEKDVYKERLEREFLSVRFLRIARMPMDHPGRKAAVEAFFRDLKRHGITEIRERRSLAVSKQIMQESQYVKETAGYSLYYIMK